MKIASIFTHGFEEGELIVPVDIWRRADIEVDLWGLEEKQLSSSRNINILADFILTESSIMHIQNNYKAIFFPGGLRNAQSLAQSELIYSLVKFFIQSKDKYALAICAASSLVLGQKSLLKGLSFTCYPGLENHVSEAHYTASAYTLSENVLTGDSLGNVFPFALKGLELISGKDKRKEIETKIIYSDKI